MIVIIKPTESCNARCLYCSASPEDGVYSGKMTDELLDRVFSEFGTFLLNRPDQEVSFTWHGGEPMLMGVPFFRKVNARQRARIRAELIRLGLVGGHDVRTVS